MAMIIKSSTLTRENIGAEQEWVDYAEGVKILVRGMAHKIVQVGLQAHREAQERAFAQYRAGDVSALAQGSTSVEINSALLGELVIADWSGLQLETGEKLDYSPGAAKSIVSDPEHIALCEWLVVQSVRISKEAADRLEGRVGKSSRSTGGTKNGGTKRQSSAKSPADSE